MIDLRLERPWPSRELVVGAVILDRVKRIESHRYAARVGSAQRNGTAFLLVFAPESLQRVAHDWGTLDSVLRLALRAILFRLHLRGWFWLRERLYHCRRCDWFQRVAQFIAIFVVLVAGQVAEGCWDRQRRAVGEDAVEWCGVANFDAWNGEFVTYGRRPPRLLLQQSVPLVAGWGCREFQRVWTSATAASRDELNGAVLAFSDTVTTQPEHSLRLFLLLIPHHERLGWICVESQLT